MSCPSTSAEIPEAWAGVPILGEMGGVGPTKGVQGCQLWTDKSKEVRDQTGQNRD